MQLSRISLDENSALARLIVQHKAITLSNSETFFRLSWNISFTSHETVYHEGTTTLLLRSVNMSRSSGSSTILKGWWRRVVICTGNPRVFLGIPIPGPGICPYPLCGSRYSHRLTRSNPRVTRYPYPSRVTCGFTTITMYVLLFYYYFII